MSKSAGEAMRAARREARNAGRPAVGRLHLLLGVLAQEGSSGQRALAAQAVTLKAARHAVAASSPAEHHHGPKHLQLTPKANFALSRAQLLAVRLGQKRIDTGHILLSLVHRNDTLVAKHLREMGVDIAQLREDARNFASNPKGRYVKVDLKTARAFVAWVETLDRDQVPPGLQAFEAACRALLRSNSTTWKGR